MKINQGLPKVFVLLFITLLIFPSCISTNKQNTMNQIKSPKPFDVIIPTTDDISIQGTIYLTEDEKAPFILLCHRAKWSRGEYLEIAPKLVELGFNCLAIDQRSGEEINGVINTTTALARAKGLSTRFIDALPDIKAALDYIKSTYNPEKLLLWGSSYSASLSIVTAAAYPEMIDALLTFSPGEFFEKQGKSKTWVQDSASIIKCPLFITAKKEEADMITPIFDAVTIKEKTILIPNAEGKHGSQALFESTEGNEEYWAGVTEFLNQFI